MLYRIPAAVAAAEMTLNEARMIVDCRVDFVVMNFSSCMNPIVELPLKAACEKPFELFGQVVFFNHWLPNWPNELKSPWDENMLKPDREEHKATAWA